GWLYRPDGAGPYPAVVLAHTCGGVSDHTDEWGKRLAKWGYVTLAPDSLTPRGHGSVCSSGAVRIGDQVADVAGAIDYLHTLPYVRKDRIGLIGHSFGGGTAVMATQKGLALADRGLRATVAYYPVCLPQLDRDVALPVLILIGEKDDWALPDHCRQVQAEATRPDLIEAVYYPGVTHGFDQEGRERRVMGAGGAMHLMSYDAAATANAEARTKAWFEKYLK
ncbi:MAG: dienelactone hydrolase family protein, partial [Alphaproteobacteria bacterium]|nr:dienelactone hydrolase family protein [Alphaproteobacteria bacterium]